MSNPALHEIYVSGIGRNFTYLRKMEDIKSEIILKNISDLETQLKSKVKELKSYKTKRDIWNEETDKLNQQIEKVSKLIEEYSKENQMEDWLGYLKLVNKRNNLWLKQRKIDDEYFKLDYDKEWEKDHAIRSKLQEEITAIDFLIDHFKDFVMKGF